MNIKILGSGCAKCQRLEKTVREAVEETAVDAVIEHVYDMKQIMAYGVMRTPALVVDEKVVLQGVIPSVGKVKELLSQ